MRLIISWGSRKLAQLRTIPNVTDSWKDRTGLYRISFVTFSEHSLDWDEWIDQAVFAYNTGVHESTGISPYEMVFGRPARMPIEVELGMPLRNPSSQSDYSQSLRKAIQIANQLTKLPAFLQGPAATYYDTIDEDDKDSLDHLLTSLKSCFAPAADREKYYREFEEQRLRTAEDPAIFLWRLKEALKNAEPDLSPSAFDALLRRQFFRGLPEEIQLKLLESDPTPSLTTMTHFAQRFRSLRNLPASSCSAVMSDSSLPTNNRESHQPPNQLETITNIVKQLAENQAQLVAAISPQPSQTHASHGPGRRPTRPVRCFFCGEEGHVVRDCAHRRRSPRCTLCSGWGHNATICANNNNHHSNHNHIPSEDEHQHHDGLRAHQQTHRDCTLVDTGSMKSIVDFQSFQRILEHCTHNNLEHPVLRVLPG
eukprot:gene18510-biopygen15597